MIHHIEQVRPSVSRWRAVLERSRELIRPRTRGASAETTAAVLPFGEIRPQTGFSQIFQAPADYLSGVAPLIATYGNGPKHSSLRIEVFRIDGRVRRSALILRDFLLRTRSGRIADRCAARAVSAFGRHVRRRRVPDGAGRVRPTTLLASVSVDLAEIYDNSFVELYFEPETASRGRHYMIRITSADARANDAATVYLTDGEGRIDGHRSCSTFGRHSRNFGLFAKLAFAPPVADSTVPPNL